MFFKFVILYLVKKQNLKNQQSPRKTPVFPASNQMLAKLLSKIPICLINANTLPPLAALRYPAYWGGKWY